MKRLLVFFSLVVSLSGAAIAQTLTINDRTKTHNFTEGVLDVPKPGTIEITATLIVSGNGAEQNPSSTSVLLLSGRHCADKTSRWQDGPNQYAFSCVVRFKRAGSYPVIAKEIANVRATATSMMLTARQIGGADDEFEVLN